MLPAGGDALESRGPRLVPGDPLSVAARVILGRRVRRLEKAMETLAGNLSDPEAVRAVRVLLRRLRSLLEVLSDAFPRREMEPVRKRLKRAGDLLGHVRDLDVLARRLEDVRGALQVPGGRTRRGARDPMGPVLTWIGARRSRAAERLASWIEGDGWTSLRDRLEALESSPPEAAPKEGRRKVAHVVPLLVFRALAEAREAAPEADSDLSVFHRARLRVKRLRYTIESFEDLLGKEGVEIQAGLKRLQDALGAIQDARQFQVWLEKVLRRVHLNATARAALEACMEDHEESLRKLRASAVEAWRFLESSDRRTSLGVAVSRL